MQSYQYLGTKSCETNMARVRLPNIGVSKGDIKKKSQNYRMNDAFLETKCRSTRKQRCTSTTMVPTPQEGISEDGKEPTHLLGHTFLQYECHRTLSADFGRTSALGKIPPHATRKRPEYYEAVCMHLAPLSDDHPRPAGDSPSMSTRATAPAIAR